MPKATPILNSFAAGELSPLLDGRTDVSRYYSGAKTLKNFITLPYGSIKRRPGTYYVSSVRDSARKSRLVSFQFSTTQSYIVEFADRFCRFYANRGQLLSGGSAYEIASPYLEADLFDLQFAQDADTMWIVHPSYKPRKLTRNAASWDSYTKLMLHMNGTDGSTTFTDEIAKVMTAAGNAQIDTAQYKFGGASGLFDGTGDYVTTPDHADFNFGTGDFTIDFWVSINNATNQQSFVGQWVDNNNYWAVYKETNAGGNKLSITFIVGGVVKGNYTLTSSWAVSTGTWYHLVFERYGTGAKIFIDGVAQTLTEGTAFGSNDVGDLASVLYVGSFNTTTYPLNGWIDELRISKGIARHTADFTPPTTAYAADIITFAINNYAPTADPFGADASNDCPSCVSIHEQRIFFANTNNDPQKIWGSKSGDYENMTTGTAAGDAFVYIIGSEQVNAIRWLSSGRVLGMGTLGGVFSMSGGSDELGITPTNVTVKRETSYGALGIVPKKIGNFVYYVQRNAKILREFGYSYDIDEYASFDTTILAEHIAGDGIVDMDYQQSPYNVLWCVRSDGVLACLTRQIDQEVLAWSRIILGGSFGAGDAVVESVAVIPGDGGDDEVWITVKRTINSATVRYIEYFKPMSWGSEQEDTFFVDSGLTLDNPKPITDITKANPGVVTATGHGFSNGDIVIIRGVKGMTEVNRTKFKVAGVSGDTFQLTDASASTNIDTSSYTAYVSGGEVRKCVTSVSGLSHLVGATVDLFIDGDTGTTAVVSAGGAITIATPANGGGEIHAGLRYTPYLKTMRIEAGSALGTAQAKLKRINKVFVRLYESLKVKIGNENTQDEFDFRDPGDTSSNTIAVFTGDKEVLQPSQWDRDGHVVITQDGPYPLTVIAIIAHLTVSDD